MDELMEKQSRQRNEQREFEEFLYRHVKRLLVVYTGVSLTFWLLAAACPVFLPDVHQQTASRPAS